MEELRNQADGQTGEIIVAVDFVPRNLADIAAIMTDPFRLEATSKRVSGKIQQAAVHAAENYEEKIIGILAEINMLAAEISMSLDFNAAFDPMEDIGALIKQMGFRLDSDGMDLPELLLEWMRTQRVFFGKKLFILYGLKAVLSEEELRALYRSVKYEKMTVLLVEPAQREYKIEGECVTIIDNDLCVIR